MIKIVDTHNLLDGQAEARGLGASVVLFCEAPKDLLRKKTKDRVKGTHKLFRVRRQRDLVIALKKSIADEAIKVRKHYKLVHVGRKKVTPHRGIFWITFEYRGEKYAIICEHRINAWYAPWIRGEKKFRTEKWHKHTAASNKIQRRLIDKGYIIIAGGDPNAPEGVEAYPLLNETIKAHLDRVAMSDEIGNVRIMKKGGSDHHRLRAHRKAA
jgi:hypothetical protein